MPFQPNRFIEIYLINIDSLLVTRNVPFFFGILYLTLLFIVRVRIILFFRHFSIGQSRREKCSKTCFNCLLGSGESREYIRRAFKIFHYVEAIFFILNRVKPICFADLYKFNFFLFELLIKLDES